MPRLRSHQNYKYNQICSRNTSQIGAFFGTGLPVKADQLVSKRIMDIAGNTSTDN
jgi:hypothetical protein